MNTHQNECILDGVAAGFSAQRVCLELMNELVVRGTSTCARFGSFDMVNRTQKVLCGMVAQRKRHHFPHTILVPNKCDSPNGFERYNM